MAATHGVHDSTSSASAADTPRALRAHRSSRGRGSDASGRRCDESTLLLCPASPAFLHEHLVGVPPARDRPNILHLPIAIFSNFHFPPKKKTAGQGDQGHDEEPDRPAHQVAGRAAAGPTVSTPTTMIVAWTGGWSSIVSRRVVADVTLAGCCLQASRLFGTCSGRAILARTAVFS